MTDHEKKVKAAKKYLGEKWCLHPKNRITRLKNVQLPLWRRVARELEARNV